MMSCYDTQCKNYDTLAVAPQKYSQTTKIVLTTTQKHSSQVSSSEKFTLNLSISHLLVIIMMVGLIKA